MTGGRKLKPLAGGLRPGARPQAGGQQHTTAEGRQLAAQARQLLRTRAEMAAYIPPGLIKDWAWDMLLELFVHTEEGTFVYVKQLILASGVSPPAAMRLIDRLEEAELIGRLADPLDSRRVIVTLSERGWEAMATLLRRICDLQDAVPGMQDGRTPSALRR